MPFAGIEPTHPDYKTGPLPLRIKGLGGDGGNRAPDPLRMKQVLYQLSYITIVEYSALYAMAQRSSGRITVY